MKRCVKCGFNNNEESYFCEGCGLDIKEENFTNNNDNPSSQKMVYTNSSNIISPEDNKKANILSTISLICFYLIAGIFLIVPSYLDRFLSAEMIDIVHISSYLVGLMFHLAGLVLMIITRVKYSGNVFGKVVMWLYIITYLGIVLLFVVGFIFIFLFIILLRSMFG